LAHFRGFGLITLLIPFAIGTLVTLQLGYSFKATILIGSFLISPNFISKLVINPKEKNGSMFDVLI